MKGKKNSIAARKGLSEIMIILAIVIIFYVVMSSFNWMAFIGSEEIASYNSQKIIQPDITIAELKAFKVKAICEYSLKMAVDQVLKGGGYYSDTMQQREGESQIETYDGVSPFWFAEKNAVFPESAASTDLGPKMLKDIDRAFTLILKNQVAMPDVLFGSNRPSAKQFYIPSVNISDVAADWAGGAFNNILSPGGELVLGLASEPYDSFTAGSLDASKWNLALNLNNKISFTGSEIRWTGSDDLLNHSYQVIEKNPREIRTGSTVKYVLKTDCTSGNNLADTEPVYFFTELYNGTSNSVLSDSSDGKHGYSRGTGEASKWRYQANVNCPQDNYIKIEASSLSYTIYDSTDGASWTARGTVSYPRTNYVKLSFGWVENSSATDKFFTGNVYEVNATDKITGTYVLAPPITALHPIIFVNSSWVDNANYYSAYGEEFEVEDYFDNGTNFTTTSSCTDGNWTNLTSATYSSSNGVSIVGCNTEVLPVINVSADVSNTSYKVYARLYQDPSKTLVYKYSFANPSVMDRSVTVPPGGSGTVWTELGYDEVKYGKFFMFMGQINTTTGATPYNGAWDTIRLHSSIAKVKVNISANNGANWHEADNGYFVDTGTDSSATNLIYKIYMESYDPAYIPSLDKIKLEYTENYAQTVVLQSLVDVGGGKLNATCASYTGVSKALSDSAITNNFAYNVEMETNVPELYKYAKEIVEDNISSSNNNITTVILNEMRLWRDQWDDRWDMTSAGITDCDDALTKEYDNHLNENYMDYRRHCPDVELLNTSDRYLGFPETQSVCDAEKQRLTDEWNTWPLWPGLSLRVVYDSLDAYIKSSLDCSDLADAYTNLSKSLTDNGHHAPHYANIEGLQIALDLYAKNLSTANYRVKMEIVPGSSSETGILVTDTSAQVEAKVKKWKDNYIKSELVVDYNRPINTLDCNDNICCDPATVSSASAPNCHNNYTFFNNPYYLTFTPREDSDLALQTCWRDNGCCENPGVYGDNTLKANPDNYRTCYAQNGCCENDVDPTLTNRYNSACWSRNLGGTCTSTNCPIFGGASPNSCTGTSNCCNYSATSGSDCCGSYDYCNSIYNVWTESTPCNQKASITRNCDQSGGVERTCACWRIEDCEMKVHRVYWIDHPITVNVKVTMLNKEGYFDNFGHPTDKSIDFYVNVNDLPGDVINESFIGPYSGASAPEPCKYMPFIYSIHSVLGTFFSCITGGTCSFDPTEENYYDRCIYFGAVTGYAET